MSDNELASSADEGSDAEKAEALNAKVQRVMAPLMKKMGADDRSRCESAPVIAVFFGHDGEHVQPRPRRALLPSQPRFV